MKKILVVMFLCTSMFALASQEKAAKSSAKSGLATGESLRACPKGCAWQSEEDCKSASQVGHLILPDQHCEKMKWLGQKQEGEVCCCNCTEESTIASEIE